MSYSTIVKADIPERPSSGMSDATRRTRLTLTQPRSHGCFMSDISEKLRHFVAGLPTLITKALAATLHCADFADISDRTETASRLARFLRSEA